ncbi:MAG: hypothetical protein EPN93_07750 [Spirochaetes bacterium]|nr:MAG: hypothetical protein EPN93_07750 [Spirochaetota bacterium]
MGPISLFDKSFLQSLSVDESVWFDHFFIANICPIFYIETLADLSKSIREGRSTEQEVGIIADKFPEMHGGPNIHHDILAINNLLGSRVPMTGQIPIAGGRYVKSNNKHNVVFENTPEAIVFSRWQKREFSSIERDYAYLWRESLKALDLESFANILRQLGISNKSCRSLKEAKTISENIVTKRENGIDLLKYAIILFNVPEHLHPKILKRYYLANCPPLVMHAPYVAYIMIVEIFFQIAIAANLISSHRPSNRIDMAYLLYLPFCMLFVSSDKLHQKCAPLFLRDDQEFVWGNKLKADLREINKYYSEYPQSEKDKGLFSFAPSPPKEHGLLVARLWDTYAPRWRMKNFDSNSSKHADDKDIIDEIKSIQNAPSSECESEFDPNDYDSIIINRQIRKTKGSWHQVQKDIKKA